MLVVRCGGHRGVVHRGGGPIGSFEISQVVLKFSGLPFFLSKLIQFSPLGDEVDPGMAAWS